MDMHPFDLEAAKHGQPVCTRDGRKVRIICFDKGGGFPLVALIRKEGEISEEIRTYTVNGISSISFNKRHPHESDDDLMIAPRRKEGWINVYKSVNPIFKSKAEAKAHNDDYANYIGTFKIEWEE